MCVQETMRGKVIKGDGEGENERTRQKKSKKEKKKERAMEGCC